MMRRIVLGIVLAVAVIVLVSAGVYVVSAKLDDALRGHCTRQVISQYQAVRDSLSADITESVIQQYDCEDGGYPVLEFVISGQPGRVLETLECTNPEANGASTTYVCRSPRLGYLELKNGGRASYSFGS
jgi:hypothetical protein